MTRRGSLSSRRQTSLVLLLSLGTLVCMTLLAVATTAVVLEVEAGARAYLLGNNLWSKAQKEAVFHLYTYADRGDPDDLAQARQSLAIPLADRRARLALERNPPDVEAARRYFLQGQNAPEDVSRLIRVYLYLKDAPHISEAIGIWREADRHIVRLVTLADQLERVIESPGNPARRRATIRRELIEIDRTLQPVEAAFAHELSAGAAWLSNILITLTAVVFALMTAIAMGIYAWLLRRIRESERDFRATFEQAAVGMAQLGTEGRFLAVNATLCQLLGYDQTELLAARPEDLLHPEERPGDAWRLERLFSGELEHYSAEHRYLRGDEQVIWGKITLSAVRGRGRRPHRLLLVLEDVTEARRLAEALSYQASHDKLTGLFNRHEVERRLEQALESARRDSQHHTLLFIDLDQFKVVNDTCGHVAGDHLLCQVAGLLEQQLRDSDTIGRLGGDEFAVILHGAAAGDALELAERLRRSVTELAFHWAGRSFSLSISVGMVEITRDVPDVTWLLSAADTACYLAKDNGRNRVHAYLETDRAVSERRGQMEWVSDIRQAIEEDRLRLFAQRIQPLHQDEGVYYELLVRLVDRHGREYAPGSFLPAAERYDLASAIDRWVVNTAFQTFAAHPDHLRALGLCHINVSAQSVTDAEFLRFVASRLDEGSVPGSKLCFEITETAAMTSLQDAHRFIDTVRERGCAIALDDFGSGLSSFGYLKYLPVDVIKIDGIFVRDMASDALDRAIVESISDIGRTLGKRTIAEFVETAEVADILRQVGVDFAQGYGIHRPCPLEELIEQPQRSRRRRGTASD